MEGTIYICSTPIGNLGDITDRAKSVLRQSDCVYAEDTRVTKKLLTCFGIHNTVKRLDENCMKQKIPEVLACVMAGKTIAYCTDAGMPSVSDPGNMLVTSARKQGVQVHVLPGASSVITAYVASGFNNGNFAFFGFFPRKASEKEKILKKSVETGGSIIFFESPKRLVPTLKFLAENVPQTVIAVCRELTKLHEEVIVSTCCNAYLNFSSRESIKGEIVLVLDFDSVDTYKAKDAQINEIESLAAILLENDVPAKKSSKILSSNFQIAAKEAYYIFNNIKSDLKK